MRSGERSQGCQKISPQIPASEKWRSALRSFSLQSLKRRRQLLQEARVSIDQVETNARDLLLSDQIDSE